MRRFGVDYLRVTRDGMWVDNRASLAPLQLEACVSVLDVGCGTGEFTRVLRAETAGRVVGLDHDARLLRHLAGPRVRGDAYTLPFRDNSVDLVVCQALLVNLEDPAAAVREFTRVAGDRVAVIEPDNSAVRVDSTVEAESDLARRARALFLAGVETDVALGSEAAALLRGAGLSDVVCNEYDHEQVIEPPYSAGDVEDVTRKATGAGLESDRETLLAASTPEEVDELRQQWRKMGREAADQMEAGEYRRREVVPFYVTVGSV